MSEKLTLTIRNAVEGTVVVSLWNENDKRVVSFESEGLTGALAMVGDYVAEFNATVVNMPSVLPSIPVVVVDDEPMTVEEYEKWLAE